MSVTSYTDPTPAAAGALVSEGIEQGAVITIVGRCEVDYDGRTSSYLAPGDRLVVLKPDGTLLVHQPEQREPVNWQPPGCTHSVRVADEQLAVRSVRSNPEETVTIAFQDVYQASTLALTDDREIDLVGSEEDLRQRILKEPSLVEEGFQPRATERETSAGAVDIYGVDTAGTPVIVELKRRRVGPDAVGQLARYVEAAANERTDKVVRGILVAPSVTDRAQRLLAEKELEFVSVKPSTVKSGPTATTLDAFAPDEDSQSG